MASPTEAHAAAVPPTIPPTTPPLRSDADVQLARGHRRSRLMLLHAVGAAGFASLLALAGMLNADVRSDQVTLPSGRAMPSLCGVRVLTGVPCPGCGLTRCFVHMAHGRFRFAWQVSPAGTAFFLLVAAQVPLQLLLLMRAWRGLEEPGWIRWNGVTLVVVASLLIAQWLLRLAN
ncbi:MAG: DUF2752 domain-containing protein [Planctomycetales bacterium]|nr:DUF2752 domain-containing protein [Planctomycetales bacterium]